jgi:hypothetical protein
MEAAGDLVINAAARHLLQRGSYHGSRLLLARLRVPIDEQIEHGRVKELWSVSEAAVVGIE